MIYVSWNTSSNAKMRCKIFTGDDYLDFIADLFEVEHVTFMRIERKADELFPEFGDA